MIKQVSKWVGVAAVALAASTSVQAQNVTLRFSNWLPPTHPMVTEMLNPWAKDVEQATEGRVKIQVLPPLGTPASHYDLVRNGVADMTIGVHSYTPERFKLTEMVELPMTAENAQVNSLAYWRDHIGGTTDPVSWSGSQPAWTTVVSTIARSFGAALSSTVAPMSSTNRSASAAKYSAFQHLAAPKAAPEPMQDRSRRIGDRRCRGKRFFGRVRFRRAAELAQRSERARPLVLEHEVLRAADHRVVGLVCEDQGDDLLRERLRRAACLERRPVEGTLEGCIRAV